ncbi:hypothetical protein VTO42DRAFT_2250 [Malbranchea cinnamomea]
MAGVVSWVQKPAHGKATVHVSGRPVKNFGRRAESTSCTPVWQWLSALTVKIACYQQRVAGVGKTEKVLDCFQLPHRPAFPVSYYSSIIGRWVSAVLTAGQVRTSQSRSGVIGPWAAYFSPSLVCREFLSRLGFSQNPATSSAFILHRCKLCNCVYRLTRWEGPSVLGGVCFATFCDSVCFLWSWFGHSV